MSIIPQIDQESFVSRLGIINYHDTITEIIQAHEWTQPFWHGSCVIAELGIDDATEIKSTDAITPPFLISLGSGAWDSEGRLCHLLFDLDVGHGADSYNNTAQAEKDAHRIANLLGDGCEIRRSKSGTGIHVVYLLPDPDDPTQANTLRKTDGPRIVKYIARYLGLHADPAAMGRQCRWLWHRHRNPHGFEPVREISARPLDLPDIIVEAMASPVIERGHGGNDTETGTVSITHDYSDGDSALEPHAVKDWTPAGPWASRSKRGGRNWLDMRHLAHDWGLPIERSIEIIRGNGAIIDTDPKQWARLLSYSRFPRGNRIPHAPQFINWDGTILPYTPKPPLALAARAPEADDNAYVAKREAEQQAQADGAAKPLTLENAADYIHKTLPPLPPDIWEGIARRGGKLTLAAPSKAGKTWMLIGLSLAIASGKPYWGRPTQRQKTLYVNMELTPESIRHRIQKVSKALDYDPVDHLSVVNLRGHVEGLQTLGPKIINAAGQGYGCIVLDPVYKLLGGRDENAAGQMAEMCNMLEKIATETNALLVLAHHFPKGNAAGKEAGDRLSGSGVFTRDPDSLVCLTPHQEEQCYAVSAVLRDHPPLEEFCVRFEFPLLTLAEGLDPDQLKQPNKAGNECTDKDVVAIMQTGTADAEWTRPDLEIQLRNRTGAGRNRTWPAIQAALRAGTIKLKERPRPGTSAEKLYVLSRKYAQDEL